MVEIEQNFSFSQLWDLGYPLLILVLGSFAALMTSLLASKRVFLWTTIVTVFSFSLSALGAILQIKNKVSGVFFGLNFDGYGQVLSIFIALIGAMVTMISYHYWSHHDESSQKEIIPETLALMLFSAVGMQLMVFAQNWIVFILALEVMSLALYILVGIRRHQVTSAEGALKYFLLGSVAAAIMLLGISFLYGATGSLDITSFSQGYSKLFLTGYLMEGMVKAGLLLVVVGFVFKVAAVPFHFWAPDVYEAAPMPVTGFMATGVKVAAFGALLRVLMTILPEDALYTTDFLVIFLGMVSVLTIVIANITALRQKSLKRVLAYSSIAHAGYLLLGVVTYINAHAAQQAATLQAMLLYLGVYSLLTVGAFSVLTVLSTKKELGDISDLNGLAKSQPLLSAALSVFLLALAGIPPLGGFFAKYFLFSQFIANHLYKAAVIAILFSAVSLYYYLAPVVAMYFMKPEESGSSLTEAKVPFYSKIVIVGMMALVFYTGMFPQGLMGLLQNLF